MGKREKDRQRERRIDRGVKDRQRERRIDREREG